MTYKFVSYYYYYYYYYYHYYYYYYYTIIIITMLMIYCSVVRAVKHPGGVMFQCTHRARVKY